MAKISIYVDDDLKARMDRVHNFANWSGCVRDSLLQETERLEKALTIFLKDEQARLEAEHRGHMQAAKDREDAARVVATTAEEEDEDHEHDDARTTDG